MDQVASQHYSQRTQQASRPRSHRASLATDQVANRHHSQPAQQVSHPHNRRRSLHAILPVNRHPNQQTQRASRLRSQRGSLAADPVASQHYSQRTQQVNLLDSHLLSQALSLVDSLHISRPPQRANRLLCPLCGLLASQHLSLRHSQRIHRANPPPSQVATPVRTPQEDPVISRRDSHPPNQHLNQRAPLRIQRQLQAASHLHSRRLSRQANQAIPPVNLLHSPAKRLAAIPQDSLLRVQVRIHPLSPQVSPAVSQPRDLLVNRVSSRLPGLRANRQCSLRRDHRYNRQDSLRCSLQVYRPVSQHHHHLDSHPGNRAASPVASQLRVRLLVHPVNRPVAHPRSLRAIPLLCLLRNLPIFPRLNRRQNPRVNHL
jgi:hypothetical protein